MLAITWSASLCAFIITAVAYIPGKIIIVTHVIQYPLQINDGENTKTFLNSTSRPRPSNDKCVMELLLFKKYDTKI